MFSQFLQFLWVSFRQYWAVWVTGTGTVGLFLFLFGFTERLRGSQVSKRTYIVVLAVTFWVLATFCAWHDSQNNLAAVERQRADDNGKLNQCTSDLRFSNFSSETWKQQSGTSQAAFNSLQTTLGGTQGAVNTCAVELAKRGQPVPERILLRWANVVSDSRDNTQIYAFLLQTVWRQLLFPVNDNHNSR